jgi:hypothetical protein
MDGYTTGGNRGDGTVFALDIQDVRPPFFPSFHSSSHKIDPFQDEQNLIFAGTRNGRIRLFDRRSTRPTYAEERLSSSNMIAKEEVRLASKLFPFSLLLSRARRRWIDRVDIENANWRPPPAQHCPRLARHPSSSPEGAAISTRCCRTERVRYDCPHFTQYRCSSFECAS